MLEIVQDEQQSLRPEDLEEMIRGIERPKNWRPHRPGDCAGQPFSSFQGGEGNEDHTIRKTIGQVSGDIDCETCFANATGTGQRHQPDIATLKQIGNYRRNRFPPEEARQWPGKRSGLENHLMIDR